MKSSKSLPAVLFLALMGAVAVIHGAAYFEIALPSCMLRKLTGIPCPFCGGTRALTACVHWEWGKAIQFNPLIVVGVVGACGWFGIWLAGWCFKRSWAMDLQQRIQRTSYLPFVFMTIFLNWCYLCWKFL
jgi:hypothetical protein